MEPARYLPTINSANDFISFLQPPIRGPEGLPISTVALRTFQNLQEPRTSSQKKRTIRQGEVCRSNKKICPLSSQSELEEIQKETSATSSKESERQDSLSHQQKAIFLCNLHRVGTEKINALSPLVWSTITSSSSTITAFSSLLDMFREEIFYWEEIMPKEHTALAFLLYKPQIDTALQTGLSIKDLLRIKDGVLWVFFSEQSHPLFYASWANIQEHKTLFFSLHPEAQLRALRIATSMFKEQMKESLYLLQKLVEQEEQSLYAAALHHYRLGQLPYQTFALFTQQHCQKILSNYVVGHPTFSYTEEKLEAWKMVMETHQILLPLFKKMSKRCALSVRERISYDPREFAHLFLHAPKLLAAISDLSPLQIETFLDIQEKIPRMFFITYAETVRAIAEYGISFETLIEHPNFQKVKWLICKWDAAKLLLEQKIPVEALLSPETPLKVFQYCSSYENELKALLQYISFDQLQLLQNEELIHAAIQNGSGIASLLVHFETSWQELLEHPLKEPLIKNAKALSSVIDSRQLSIIEVRELLATLSLFAANRVLPKLESYLYLLQNEGELKERGISLTGILNTPSNLQNGLLDYPRGALQFLFLFPEASSSNLYCLFPDQLESLFKDPEAIVGLSRYIPLGKLLEQTGKMRKLLANARDATSLFETSTLDVEMAVNAYTTPQISRVFEEIEVVYELKKKGKHTEKILPNSLVKQVNKRAKEREFERGKALLLEKTDLQESAFEENSLFMQKVCKNAQIIALLLLNSPYCKVQDVLNYMKSYPNRVEFLFEHAGGVPILIEEGFSLEELLSMAVATPTEFADTCKDAYGRCDEEMALFIDLLLL